MIKITHIDHFVLTVDDIDKTIQFYESTLGMQQVGFGNGRGALCFGNQKNNLHKAGNKFEPKTRTPTPGSGDFCFIIESGLSEAMEHVKSAGVEIIEGPVERTGASGPIMSFYFRDPDQNLIEVAEYKSTA